MPTSRHARAAALRLAVAAFFLPAAACDGGAEGSSAAPPAAPPAVAAPVDPERARAAAELLRQAGASEIPAKVDLLRRYVALYDDLPEATLAHLQLCLYLRMDDRTQGSLEPAFAAVRTFADRKPRAPEVSEAFRQLAQILASAPESDFRTRVFDAWEGWLEAREQANDLPPEILLFEIARAKELRKRWSEAEATLDAALATASPPPGARIEA
ncbi:MAG TPA: hypothetical protein VEI02_01965, partial [Planctomycetota bacterium]|nr:hypothetical protein [Planctomycetota bacterium]